MGYFEGGWAPYVPVAQRRRNAESQIDKHMKRHGRTAAPVVLEGRTIARTFWGKAWCENLERYSDFSNRLPRGRTYVRNGSVIDLHVEEGRVHAFVAGSSLYEVVITIHPLLPQRWRAIVTECAGRIGSLVELLGGRLSDGVMAILARSNEGLFPAPTEINLRCSCPDGASMCKHVAAVLYGVGARLDRSPELFFTLRKVDQLDLIASAENAPILGHAAIAGEKKLAIGADLSALFGIDIAPPSSVAVAPARPLATANSSATGRLHTNAAPAPVTRRSQSLPPAPAARAVPRKIAPAPMPAYAPPAQKLLRKPPLRRVASPVPRRSRSQSAQAITGTQLLAAGLPEATLKSWVTEGILTTTDQPGIYLRTPEAEREIELLVRKSLAL